MENLTLLVPVYNERLSLSALLNSIDAVFKKLPEGSVCIIADDGSTDETATYITQQSVYYRWLKLSRSQDNQGKSHALFLALANVDSTWVAFMDGDLQNDPHDLLEMLELLTHQNGDAIVGWRKRRNDPFHKNLLSKLYNNLLNCVFGMRLHDHNCGIKIIRRTALLSIPLTGEWHRYITVLLHAAGFKLDEMIVKHHPRMHGRSRYGFGRYIRFIYDLPAVVIIARQLRRSHS